MKQRRIAIVALCLCVMGSSSRSMADTARTPIDGDAFEQASAEVQSVQVDFCGEVTKSKAYMVTAGKSQEICLEARNSSDQDIVIALDFVDGTLTNDQRKNRACMGNDQKEQFGQYVTGSQSLYTIPAQGSERIIANIRYPKGIQGNIMGCVVYYTKGASAGQESDVSILVRRAKFIDVTVRSAYCLRYAGAIIIVLAAAGLWLYSNIRKKHSRHLSAPRKRSSHKKS